MDSDPAPPTRPSDTDRSRVLSRLGAALGSGRLDLLEYERRSDLARTATSSAELARLADDLPAEPPEQQARELREWLDEWRWWAAGAVVMVGTWGVQSVADSELRSFWPGVPLGIWALVLLAVTLVPRGGDRPRG